MWIGSETGTNRSSHITVFSRKREEKRSIYLTCIYTKTYRIEWEIFEPVKQSFDINKIIESLKTQDKPLEHEFIQNKCKLMKESH